MSTISCGVFCSDNVGEAANVGEQHGNVAFLSRERGIGCAFFHQSRDHARVEEARKQLRHALALLALKPEGAHRRRQEIEPAERDYAGDGQRSVRIHNSCPAARGEQCRRRQQPSADARRTYVARECGGEQC